VTLVALIVTFIGSNSERVSIVLPNDHPAEQVQDALLRTQDQWVSIPAVVDGAPTTVYVRPDRYGMFFFHEVDDLSALT
jgi:hypothetical protein